MSENHTISLEVTLGSTLILGQIGKTGILQPGKVAQVRICRGKYAGTRQGLATRPCAEYDGSSCPRCPIVPTLLIATPPTGTALDDSQKEPKSTLSSSLAQTAL